LLVATFPAANLIILPFIGGSLDKLGYRIPFTFGMICLMASTILFMIVQTMPMLFLARILQGFSSAVTMSASSTCVAEVYPSSERTGALGLLLVADGLGAVTGPIAGGGLYKYSSKNLHAPFLFVVVLVGLDAIARVILLPSRSSPVDEVLDRQSSSSSSAAAAKHSSARSAESAEPSDIAIFFAQFTKKYLLLAFFYYILMGGTLAAVQSIVPVYISKEFGAKPGEIGTLFFFCIVAYAVTTALAGWLMERFHTWSVTCVSTLMMAGAFAAFPLARNLKEIVLCGCAIGAALGAAEAATMHGVRLAAELYFGRKYGNSFALVSMSFMIGNVIGSIVTSGIADLRSYRAAFFAWAMFVMCFVPVALFYRGLEKAAGYDVAGGDTGDADEDEEHEIDVEYGGSQSVFGHDNNHGDDDDDGDDEIRLRNALDAEAVDYDHGHIQSHEL
jgi:MFS family permease